MKEYNKIVIASEMLVEAHNRYDNAKSEIDYVSSILLSGAVVGIIAPLLEEQGGVPMHEILARISNAIGDDKSEEIKSGFFRSTYNAFKHAGDTRRKVSASEDLTIVTDIKLEAGRMLDVAKSDFKQISVVSEVRSQISETFIQLLQSDREYE